MRVNIGELFVAVMVLLVIGFTSSMVCADESNNTTSASGFDYTDAGNGIVGGISELEQPSVYDLLEYYPLTQGSWWEYEYSVDGFGNFPWQEKYIIGNYETIHGVSAIQRAYYDSGYFNMTTVDDYDLFFYDSQFMYLHGNNQVGNPSWRYYPLGLRVFDPEIKFNRFMKVGDSYIITANISYEDGSTDTLTLQ